MKYFLHLLLIRLLSLSPGYRFALLLARERNSKKIETFLSVSHLATLFMDPIFLADDEISLLQKYSANNKRGELVEIGSAYGASTVLLLTHSNIKLSMYSIDPFIIDSMGSFRATYQRCSDNVKRMMKVLNLQSKLSKWNLIQDYSYNLNSSWNKVIGLLFLDGDHRYREVKRDFQDWLPHVVKGGHILIHDSRLGLTSNPNTSGGWPGPTKLANELKSHRCVKLVDYAHSLTVWQKTDRSCSLCKTH